MKKTLLSAVLLVLATGLWAAASSDTITIASIILQNDIYFKTVQIGIKDTSAKLGVDVLYGNYHNKADKESELIDTYIARGVEAIIIQPLSFKGSAAALKRAQEAGIKIVFMGEKADLDDFVTHIASRNVDLGIETGKVAKEIILNQFAGQTVNIATLSFRSQFPEAADARTNGFLDQVMSLPGVTLVAEQDAWLAEQAIQVVGDMITANPNLNVIHAANEGGTVGATIAVKNAGKVGEILVFGTDGSDQLAQMLLSDDNILQVATAQNPYEVGKLSVEAALKAINGESVTKEIVVPVRSLKRSEAAEVQTYIEEISSYQ